MFIEAYGGTSVKDAKYFDIKEVGKEGQIEGAEEKDLYELARLIIGKLRHKTYLINLAEDIEIRMDL